MLGDTAIGWKSSTQKFVTTATCEAEYVALSDASKGGALHESCPSVLAAWFDRDENGDFRRYEGAKAIEDISSSASRSKHIDVNLHFIRGLIRAGEARIVHVGTEEQHADVLTKPL